MAVCFEGKESLWPEKNDKFSPKPKKQRVATATQPSVETEFTTNNFRTLATTDGGSEAEDIYCGSFNSEQLVENVPAQNNQGTIHFDPLENSLNPCISTVAALAIHF